MLLIQRLAWLAFQGSIVGTVCYAFHDMAQQSGEPVQAGLALTLGIGIAYALTLFVSVFLDAGRILIGKINGKAVAPKHRRGPAPIAPPRRSFGSPW
ncbi:hypothetical protein [Methylobacterium longum]|uniref:Uncharacterized protein n=1 Tax=Methylobacterium longum TaxID=767694 RepID=A0ABT8ATL6_9HYPH|nr:hypothetical protein [Methylobacterium longum]MDN3572950.1 hypothetical protein [Methylobacterium longum]GJE14566.1 hypothetical protein FOHLNKBM_5641 [Methylobacterium longum]